MAVTAIARMAIDFALPPRCAACGAIVRDQHTLCTQCWSGLDFLTGAGCLTCGAPVQAGGLQCGPCLQHPPDHDGARAAVTYGEVARTIVMRLKYGRRIALARFAGGIMARTIAGTTNGLLIPVPLHRWRIWSRGFNQSLALAQAIAIETGMATNAEILVRRKRTPLLRGLGAHQRKRAVAGAFSVHPTSRPALAGRDVVLVDDVYTSGATANACARVLKRAGASSVTVLCWARVLRPD